MVNYTSIQMNLNGVNCPICTSFGSTEDTEWTEDKETMEFYSYLCPHKYYIDYEKNSFKPHGNDWRTDPFGTEYL